MPKAELQVAVPILYERNFPSAAWIDAAKALEASGVVDQLQTWGIRRDVSTDIPDGQ
jgi:hypothetical protein